MANTKQKTSTLNINDQLEANIQDKFNNGWVITQIVSLTPVLNKILIIYAKPEDPDTVQ